MPRLSIPDFQFPQWISQTIASLLRRSHTVWIMLLASFLLSGCIQSDLGLQFDNPNQGRIVQRIHIEERLITVSGASAQEWLETIAQRTRNLGGQVERQANQTVVVTIPFSNNADLETKFNQFFGSSQKTNPSLATKMNHLPEIKSNLTLKRNNLLLVERNRLHYELDLRSLGIFSSEGNLLISPSALINLEFRLKTPWGARSLTSTPLPPAIRETGDLVWHLVPGELNQIEAVFWLPSPLGIGTLVIVLLVLAGTFLKYPQVFTGANLSAPQ
ncbi:DUF3153 domain-containing protein [Kovacikia minuta CCNUW1]|uniref:DUF3153 domain-containing protein n=1 Tax=Kovacikia minuta TaxID=2931930 RepID=UPI001CCEF8EC|nr:DUF3153 domain-containing protein [Kovacikia minuta]UBF28647.1 DUF3153 domain-containing protein [Kovacikia minuta CCNUW1]